MTKPSKRPPPTASSPEALARATAPAFLQILAGIEALEQRLAQLDAIIAQALPPQSYSLARSLPGFGTKTTPALLAFIAADVTVRDRPERRELNAGERNSSSSYSSINCLIKKYIHKFRGRRRERGRARFYT